MINIQIRNVLEQLSCELKAKVSLEGRSLSDFLLGELERLAARPTRAELLARISSRESTDLPPAEDVLAAQRAAW